MYQTSQNLPLKLQIDGELVDNMHGAGAFVPSILPFVLWLTDHYLELSQVHHVPVIIPIASMMLFKVLNF